MKKHPNHRMKNLKKKYSQNQNVCTHVSSINLKRKVSDTKNIVTAHIYFCIYPYGTPCTTYIAGNNVANVELRIKTGKNDDIMGQLRNALQNRKKRSSLLNKYQDLK